MCIPSRKNGETTQCCSCFLPVRCEVFLFFDDPDDPSIRHAKSLEDYAQSKKMAGAGLSVHRMDTSWWEKAKARSRFYQRQDAWINNSEPVAELVKLSRSTCLIIFGKNKVNSFNLNLHFRGRWLAEKEHNISTKW